MKVYIIRNKGYFNSRVEYAKKQFYFFIYNKYAKML